MTESEYDKMLIVKILYQRMNWSFRRIGRLFDQSKNTISTIYRNGLELPDEEDVTNSSLGGEVSLMYVGGSNEVEYADADTNHVDTGGGIKIDQHYKGEE